MVDLKKAHCIFIYGSFRTRLVINDTMVPCDGALSLVVVVLSILNTVYFTLIISRLDIRSYLVILK